MANEIQSGQVTRSQFLKRGVLAGALVAAPVATAATWSGGAADVIAQDDGPAGSFPGGSAYDAVVRKMAQGKTLKIGFTPPILSENFDQIEHACWRQMKNYQDRFGIKWKWTRAAPKGNFDAVQEHFDIVQNWVTGKFDAIMICTAGDFAAMQKVYEDAEKAGTSIYQFNMPMDLWNQDDVKATSNIGYDNQRQSGYLAGSYLAEKLGGKGKILQVWGPSGHWAESRQKGLDQAMKDFPGLEIVGKADGGYVRDKGFAAAQNLLERNPDVNAVYGENEEMALGASQAIDARGLKQWDGKDGILTIGADGLRSGFKAIREGRLTATIDVGGVEQGLRSIQTIFEAEILGKAVEKIIEPSTLVVDKSNVELADSYTAWALAGPEY